jgi:hypothetical protein
VTLEELDVALEELEVRLERLRALYEQYFLGFEKIEPSVARKDVDRRIYVLRREKIRNTGKRFKLQTIIQRYNTFQQYWQRICREIENGTYKRHLLRAERQLAPEGQLTIAARRRFGKLLAAGAGEGITNAAEAARADARGSQPPRPSSLPPESGDLATRPPPPPRASSDAPAFGSEAPTQVAPRRAPPPKPERQRPLSTPPDPNAAKFDSLELDMGFLGSWVPPAPSERPAPPAPPAKPAARPAAPPKPVIRPAEPAVPASEVAAPPPAAAPRPPPKPNLPPAKPRPAPTATAPTAAGLSDDRVRDLHQKLLAMKRENKEAGQVSLEALSRSLRETENKLRAQHKDRRIDFDVVIRDGKAIVKPTVK